MRQRSKETPGIPSKTEEHMTDSRQEVEIQHTLDRLGEKLASRLAKENGPNDEVVHAAERMRSDLSSDVRYGISVADIVAAALAQYESVFSHAPPQKLVDACNEWLHEQGHEAGTLTEQQFATRVAEAVVLIESGEEHVYGRMREAIPTAVADVHVQAVVEAAYAAYGSRASDTF